MREELDDLLHVVFVDLRAEGRVALLGGWTGLDIGLLDLPFNIGGAPGGFGSERRVLKYLNQAAIEHPSYLRSVRGAAGIGGLGLFIGGFTHQDLVSVGSVFFHYAARFKPAGDWRGDVVIATDPRLVV